jgi:hypothetical protein
MSATKDGKAFHYKLHGRHDEISLHISRAEALKLIAGLHAILTLPCRYCGVIPSVGVDRLINSEGYTCTNSVPCCSICNSMKSRLSESEFYQHLEKIHARKQETA